MNVIFAGGPLSPLVSLKPIITALLRIKLSVARGGPLSSGVSLDNSCLHWSKLLSHGAFSYMYYVLVPRSIERRNQLLADISVTLKSRRSLVCRLFGGPVGIDALHNGKRTGRELESRNCTTSVRSNVRCPTTASRRLLLVWGKA